jgi:hypothetical protein
LASRTRSCLRSGPRYGRSSASSTASTSRRQSRLNQFRSHAASPLRTVSGWALGASTRLATRGTPKARKRRL